MIRNKKRFSRIFFEDAINFRLVYDGIVVNNDMPFGTLERPKRKVMVNDKIVSDIAFTDEKWVPVLFP